MIKTLSEIQEAAAALYDGGWRASDKEELMTEHDLDEVTAEQICKQLDIWGV